MIFPVSKALGARRGVYVAPGCKLKIGTAGKARDPKEALSNCTKSERRRIRKDLRAAGHHDIIQATL